MVALIVFSKLVILGPGLMGASVAQAIKEKGLCESITAWSRRSGTRKQCAQQPWCDVVEDHPEKAVKGADLVIVGTPVETIAPIVGQVALELKRGAIVTDLGSTKALICHACAAHMPSGVSFIGSHPMAGSEKRGMAYADAKIFNNQPCFVTPLAESDPSAVQRIVRLWEALGMRVSTVSAEEHDKIVAHISHLPHILASCLCRYLAERDADWQHCAGSGLRDSTRIAAGDPGLWQGIIEQNREEMLQALEGFRASLDSFETALMERDSAEISNILTKGKAYRDRL